MCIDLICTYVQHYILTVQLLWLISLQCVFSHSLVISHKFIINTLRPRKIAVISQVTYSNQIKSNQIKSNQKSNHKISLKFVPYIQINNITALIQIMAWHRSGNKPLSASMMVSLLMHVCITRSQRVKDEKKTIIVNVLWLKNITMTS